jgi:hypothetical protein
MQRFLVFDETYDRIINNFEPKLQAALVNVPYTAGSLDV